MRADVMHATNQAKSDRAWYFKQVSDRLHISPREARWMYSDGLLPPVFPMPTLRDVKTWDLWLLYQPYPAQYVIELRQSR